MLRSYHRPNKVVLPKPMPENARPDALPRRTNLLWFGLSHLPASATELLRAAVRALHWRANFAVRLVRLGVLELALTHSGQLQRERLQQSCSCFALSHARVPVLPVARTCSCPASRTHAGV